MEKHLPENFQEILQVALQFKMGVQNEHIRSEFAKMMTAFRRMADVPRDEDPDEERKIYFEAWESWHFDILIKTIEQSSAVADSADFQEEKTIKETRRFTEASLADIPKA